MSDKQDWRLPKGFQWDEDEGPSIEERMQIASTELESAIAALRRKSSERLLVQLVEAAKHIWKATQLLPVELDENGEAPYLKCSGLRT